uniref:Uncharacterized protein n=1 Tax=Arundo donax TaxID=35708 RepID=A0A0A9Q6D7_ARUDO
MVHLTKSHGFFIVGTWEHVDGLIIVNTNETSRASICDD